MAYAIPLPYFSFSFFVSKGGTVRKQNHPKNARLADLLSSSCLWWKTGEPICNGFALVIVSIFVLVIVAVIALLVWKGVPAVWITSSGLIAYRQAKRLWRRWFGLTTEAAVPSNER